MNDNPKNPRENGETFAAPLFVDFRPGVSDPKRCGLTKRELFAAMMLQGLLSGDWTRDTADMHAEAAVDFADALLAELAKERP